MPVYFEWRCVCRVPLRYCGAYTRFASFGYRLRKGLRRNTLTVRTGGSMPLRGQRKSHAQPALLSKGLGKVSCEQSHRWQLLQ